MHADTPSVRRIEHPQRKKVHELSREGISAAQVYSNKTSVPQMMAADSLLLY